MPRLSDPACQPRVSHSEVGFGDSIPRPRASRISRNVSAGAECPVASTSLFFAITSRRAEVVSLHCPLTPDNRGLINAERLALMQPNAFLINTARGPLVVEQNLADALNAGKLAGAALDVLPVEPPQKGSPLLGARNSLVTPHIAWATKESRARLMETAVENLRAFLTGKPRNVVN